MPKTVSGTPKKDTSTPSSQTLHHGAIRMAAIAAAAEALNAKAQVHQDKPAHPLPPCLRDVDRQTD
jgi:hypothetical protein